MKQKPSQIMINMIGFGGDNVNREEVAKRIREEFGEDFWYYWNLPKDNDVDDWY